MWRSNRSPSYGPSGGQQAGHWHQVRVLVIRRRWWKLYPETRRGALWPFYRESAGVGLRRGKLPCYPAEVRVNSMAMPVATLREPDLIPELGKEKRPASDVDGIAEAVFRKVQAGESAFHQCRHQRSYAPEVMESTLPPRWVFSRKSAQSCIILALRFQIEGVVVGRAHGVTGRMSKLKLDVLMVVALLMQDGGCHPSKTMAGHTAFVSHPFQRHEDGDIRHRLTLCTLAGKDHSRWPDRLRRGSRTSIV